MLQLLMSLHQRNIFMHDGDPVPSPRGALVEHALNELKRF